MPFQTEAVAALAVALGIGLLLGAERDRRKGEGLQREAAGVRTFTLVALAGSLLVGPLLAGESAVDAINSSVSRSVAQTLLTTGSILCGLLLILFVQPHGEAISTWRDMNRRHALLTLALLGGFAVVAADPTLRAMFELQPLSSLDCAVLACVAVAWAESLHWIWRWHLLERLLGTDDLIRAEE